MKKYVDLWNLTAGHRKLYFLAIICMGLGSFFAFLTPLVGKVTLDHIISQDTIATPFITEQIILFLGGTHYLHQRLWIPALILLGISCLSGFLLYIKDRFSIRSCESITRLLREKLYSHIQHISLLPFSNFESGDLVQRCTSDIETVRVFLSKQVVEICRALIMLLLVVPMMVAINLKMAALSLCLIPLIVTFSYIFFRKIKAVFLKVDQAEGALTSTLQENLTGIRVVRAFVRQEHEIRKFDERNSVYRDEEFRLIKALGIYWGISDFLCIGQTGLTLFGGGWLASQNEISIGTLYAFITYLGILLWPIRQMGRTLTDTGKAVVSLGRVTEVLNSPDETENLPSDGFKFEEVKGKIVIRDLSFHYNNSVPAINDISFEIEPEKTVAIVGPTGSGKSTLIRLLLRLYDYETGSIQLDGREINRIPRKELRKIIGAVLQEPFIYTKTARENIGLADCAKNESEIFQAATDASIHHSIKNFRQGYDTEIGERGVTLSGGQKQRVTMARSFLKSVPVLFWDDALSAVDSKTENQILETLQSRYGKLTTVLITHRLSVCQRVEKIIVMDKGRIIQQGNHWELISQEGFYKTVWDIQNSSKIVKNDNQD